MPVDGFQISTGTKLLEVDEPMYIPVTEIAEDFTIHCEWEIVSKQLESITPKKMFEWFMVIIDEQMYKAHERIKMKGLKWDSREVDQILWSDARYIEIPNVKIQCKEGIGYRKLFYVDFKVVNNLKYYNMPVFSIGNLVYPKEYDKRYGVNFKIDYFFNFVSKSTLIFVPRDDEKVEKMEYFETEKEKITGTCCLRYKRRNNNQLYKLMFSN